MGRKEPFYIPTCLSHFTVDEKGACLVFRLLSAFDYTPALRPFYLIICKDRDKIDVEESITGGFSMPFAFIRDIDIVEATIDAAVFPANSLSSFCYGSKAPISPSEISSYLPTSDEGPLLGEGEVAVTNADSNSFAHCILYASPPVWQKGGHKERTLLRKCFRNILDAAYNLGIQTLAFPLFFAHIYGFPKWLAKKIAEEVALSFLSEHEMTIFLVTPNAELISPKPYRDMANGELTKDCHFSDEKSTPFADYFSATPSELPYVKYADFNAEKILETLSPGFSQTLLKFVDRSDETPPAIYHRAHVSRKVFSSIQCNFNYHPSRQTAIAFAIALKLDIDETRELLASAGYVLNPSSPIDRIVEECIKRRIYNFITINEILHDNHLPSLQ